MELVPISERVQLSSSQNLLGEPGLRAEPSATGA
jgi:hypothetical protein